MDFDEMVEAELKRARAKFAPLANEWEGAEVLREEFEELAREVHKKQSEWDHEAMLRELVQVAAMAVRNIEDVCCATSYELVANPFEEYVVSMHAGVALIRHLLSVTPDTSAVYADCLGELYALAGHMAREFVIPVIEAAREVEAAAVEGVGGG